MAANNTTTSSSNIETQSSATALHSGARSSIQTKQKRKKRHHRRTNQHSSAENNAWASLQLYFVDISRVPNALSSMPCLEKDDSTESTASEQRVNPSPECIVISTDEDESDHATKPATNSKKRKITDIVTSSPQQTKRARLECSSSQSHTNNVQNTNHNNNMYESRATSLPFPDSPRIQNVKMKINMNNHDWLKRVVSNPKLLRLDCLNLDTKHLIFDLSDISCTSHKQQTRVASLTQLLADSSVFQELEELDIVVSSPEMTNWLHLSQMHQLKTLRLDGLSLVEVINILYMIEETKQLESIFMRNIVVTKVSNTLHCPGLDCFMQRLLSATNVIINNWRYPQQDQQKWWSSFYQELWTDIKRKTHYLEEAKVEGIGFKTCEPSADIIGYEIFKRIVRYRGTQIKNWQLDFKQHALFESAMKCECSAIEKLQLTLSEDTPSWHQRKETGFVADMIQEVDALKSVRLTIPSNRRLLRCEKKQIQRCQQMATKRNIKLKLVCL